MALNSLVYIATIERSWIILNNIWLLRAKVLRPHALPDANSSYSSTQRVGTAPILNSIIINNISSQTTDCNLCDFRSDKAYSGNTNWHKIIQKESKFSKTRKHLAVALTWKLERVWANGKFRTLVATRRRHIRVLVGVDGGWRRRRRVTGWRRWARVGSHC